MSINFEKVAEMLEKSSQDIKNLMFSVELGQTVNDIAFENNLDEETALKLADEVGYVILDLKPRVLFEDSLLKIGISGNVASFMAKEIETKVFSELDKVKNKPQENTEAGKAQPQQPQSQKGVGESFEQIILNQARAMQPAKPADGRVTKYEVRSTIKEEKPVNLPTEDKTIKTPDYSGGQDPYREPTE